MKKTFPLHADGRQDARVRDKIRQEINRYERRERRKPLPEGADRWEFSCRIGKSAEDAAPIPFKSLPAEIETIGASGAATVYVEIVSKPVSRAGGAGSGR
jgi:hypothetical protein